MDNKLFSGTALMQLVRDVSKLNGLVLDNEETEIKLSFFLLIRKTFNDAYDKIKQHIADEGEMELGDAFSGITGEYVRGVYAERGSAYQPSEEIADYVKDFNINVDADLIDPEFFDVSLSVKPKTKEIRNYIKQNRELPVGVEHRKRTKSMTLSATPQAKQLLEDNNKNNLDVLYDLEIPEIKEFDEEAEN